MLLRLAVSKVKSVILVNRDLHFCTIHGGLKMHQLATTLSVLDRLICKTIN